MFIRIFAFVHVMSLGMPAKPLDQKVKIRSVVSKTPGEH